MDLTPHSQIGPARRSSSASDSRRSADEVVGDGAEQAQHPDLVDHRLRDPGQQGGDSVVRRHACGRLVHTPIFADGTAARHSPAPASPTRIGRAGAASRRRRLRTLVRREPGRRRSAA
ncbi:hypothetical protein [Frankia gtarii]|uniref:hypothetical protein n=1 Tax=Frankia gtarii TaxID=2950102 RepID=UPI0021BFA939|nr:hypothetical protein [Frankia gtarii]